MKLAGWLVGSAVEKDFPALNSSFLGLNVGRICSFARSSLYCAAAGTLQKLFYDPTLVVVVVVVVIFVIFSRQTAFFRADLHSVKANMIMPKTAHGDETTSNLRPSLVTAPPALVRNKGT